MHFNVHASSLALSLLSHWLEGCCIIHEKFASTLISHYITPATALQPSHHLSAPLCTLCTIVHTTAQSHALYVQTKRYRFFSFNSCLAISAVQTRHILFMDQDKVEVHKHAKKKNKRTRPMSSHLDRTSLANKGFILWDKTPKRDIQYFPYCI